MFIIKCRKALFYKGKRHFSNNNFTTKLLKNRGFTTNSKKNIKRVGQSDEEVISLCNRYLNSQMKSYMPWGMNIYQAVSYDLQTESAQMLPSYIYYGVSSKEAVIVSKLGVPRFAVENVLKVLKEKHAEVPISVEYIMQLKEIVSGIDATDYQVENVSGKVIKEIVNKRIK